MCSITLCTETAHLTRFDSVCLLSSSQYAEEFRDSKGFGWQDESQHKFDWQTLVNKKVNHRVLPQLFKPVVATSELASSFSTVWLTFAHVATWASCAAGKRDYTPEPGL